MSKPPQPTKHNRTNQVTVQWQGPIPPPAVLEHIDRIVPGGADRLIRMTEAEQAHRIACEQKALDAQIRDTKSGSWMGLSVAGACVAAGVYAVHVGAPWQTVAVFMSVVVAGLVKAFIQGRSNGSGN